VLIGLRIKSSIELSQNLLSRRFLPALVTLLAVTTVLAQPDDREGERPSLSLRATPPVGFTPLRVRFVVNLRGGDDDYADYYCAAVEWDWGDGTKSESSMDCEPFVAGKSRIQRRYTAEHTYRNSGGFRMRFRLLQGDEIVENTETRIQVRRGTGGN
jgi:hypothetical protein